jgi:UDP-N-acetylmuramate-alanine ligase
LREKGVRAMHLYPFEAIVDHLQHTARAGDVVVAMGAGPVWQVAKGYLDA